MGVKGFEWSWEFMYPLILNGNVSSRKRAQIGLNTPGLETNLSSLFHATEFSDNVSMENIDKLFQEFMWECEFTQKLQPETLKG